MNILFKTMIGSHIWRMNHEGSDFDYFQCYLAPTLDILKGTAKMGNDFTVDAEKNTDTHSHELQTVISQLLKGNLNFVMGVMSPIVVESGPIHHELVSLFKAHPPKNLYHSTRGMTASNIGKYSEDLNSPNIKRANTILRVLQMGIKYLNTGELQFDPYAATEMNTLHEIGLKMNELDEAYKNSKLEESLPEDQLRAILLKARLENLKASGKVL